ncbi:MAG: hypothetical protein ACRD4U_06030 [Candidatus Acidiferrales bacterium]
MARWTGQALTLQLGCNWTYKLTLEEQTDAGPKPQLILGRQMFPTEEEARAAGEQQLQEELAKRSG